MAALSPLLLMYLVVWAVLAPGSAPVGDEGPLLGAARRLTEGTYALPGASDGTKFLWHGPGLPALLSPFLALRIPMPDLRLLVGPVVMFAAVLLFYRLLRLRRPRRDALIGAYALGLYAPAYQTLPSLHKEPLALLLVIVAMDAGVRFARGGRRRHVAVAALALGGLVMTRLEYGWVVIGLAALTAAWWLFARTRSHDDGRVRAARRWALVGAGGALACIPWLAYTYDLTGHLMYWGNSGGMSLYWMSQSGPGQLGQWHALHTVLHDPRLAAYRPFLNYVNSLGPLESDLTLRHAATVAALQHPLSYLVNLAANVGRMFVGVPFSFTLPVAVLAGLIAFNATLLAAVAAAAARVRRARRSLPDEALPFFLFAGLALVIHLLPSAEPRMLIPVLPIAIWLIVQALVGPRTDRALSEAT
jgi:hypothetical protein